MSGPTSKDFAQWFSGKQFTAAWSRDQFAGWANELLPLRNQAVDVLEVGAGEGRASVFFLRYFASGRLTSIDSFWNKDDEKLYEGNVREFGDRIQPIKKLSLDALNELVWAGRLYDVIYLDGTHERDLLLIDSILAWKLLKVGGLLIWSNYGYGDDLPDEWRPRTAIELFLRMQIGTYKLLFKGYQVAIRRTKDRAPINVGEPNRQQ